MLKKIIYLLLLFVVGANISIAQYNPPVVTNVDFNMRTDGSRIVDITYNVNDTDGNNMTITVKASSDDGVTWNLSINNVTGDVGSGITSGIGKIIIWDAGVEHPNFSSQTVKIKIIAEDGTTLPDLDMITVQGGTFMMGSNNGHSDERPIHSVTLRTFQIGKVEVTQRLWKAVMGTNPSNFTGNENRPVEQVSWNHVQQFITKLNQLTGKNYRLPTEAEWEYAARGGNQNQGYTYAGSNDANTVSWYLSNSGNTTHPVGTKAPNELGIYDMSGNVLEWCNDWHSENYYSISPSDNPTGPETGIAKIQRGGGYGSDAFGVRSAERSYNPPTGAFSSVGFRLALDTVDISSLLGLEMVTIQGSTFLMGSTTGYSNEQPVHSVTLSTFKIAKYEVTQRLWKAVMGTNPSNFTGDENRPVEHVSWYDVQQFITKINQLTGKNYRLPTEAEWEYAARGGNQSQGYTYAGSNDINVVAWYSSNSGGTTHPVGTKAPNELGLYDMSGNVLEWCNDWFSDTYYSVSTSTNPPGPNSSDNKVSRGGSWGVGNYICRSACRWYANPNGFYYEYGFRLAEDL